ncbi:hypothetical protein [Streptomyces sp. C]|uniref:hypothetical protein n=1 Tax=Streptomyces sp. C TaxID=253839 RepID=UPI0001B536AF|nr:hypothetical protein [Streptomyces sp. C]EFL15295.1 predicted protein [Streptomyces sp. C]
MSEPLPEEPVTEEPEPGVEPPASMGPEDFEFWDNSTQTFYERRADGTVIARPFNESEVAQQQAELAIDSLHAEAAFAIEYLDDRIDLCLAFLANPAPTAEESAAQARVVADLAAYSAGTLKRLIKVIAVMLNKPV